MELKPSWLTMTTKKVDYEMSVEYLKVWKN